MMDFGSMNTSQHKVSKGIPNMQNKGPSRDNHPLKNFFKSQTKKGNGKMKKDTGKWCDFNKIPCYNTDECHTKPCLTGRLP